MFSDIGTKIKRYTKAVCLAGMGLSIVGGLICILMGLFGGEASLIVSGLSIGAAGAVASWLGSLAFYAYGELVENSCIQTELLLRMERRTRE